jgi:hypothetical protein
MVDVCETMSNTDFVAINVSVFGSKISTVAGAVSGASLIINGGKLSPVTTAMLHWFHVLRHCWAALDG